MTLQATLDLSGDAPRLLAPTVGRFRPAVAPGAWLSSGDTLGHLEILGRAVPVVMPRTPQVLQVTALLEGRGWRPVGYGDFLLAVQVAAADAGEGVALLRNPAAEGLPDNAAPVEAPTDGLYYRSPTPDDPPFVAEGDLIKPGQVIGLIEVMKFFYEIRFEAPGFEQGARVARLVAPDASPVSSGDILIFVVPA